jgi:hypothetical protein
MKRPEQKWEEMEVPKLCPHVKKKNGASSHRLSECIDALEDHLEEDDVQKDAGEHRPNSDAE